MGHGLVQSSRPVEGIAQRVDVIGPRLGAGAAGNADPHHAHVSCAALGRQNTCRVWWRLSRHAFHFIAFSFHQVYLGFRDV